MLNPAEVGDQFDTVNPESSAEKTVPESSCEINNDPPVVPLIDAGQMAEAKDKNIVHVIDRLVSKSNDPTIKVDDAEFPVDCIVNVGHHEYLQSDCVIKWLETKINRTEVCTEALNNNLVRVWNDKSDVFDVYCLRVKYTEDGARSSLQEIFVLYKEPTRYFGSIDDIFNAIPNSVSKHN